MTIAATVFCLITVAFDAGQGTEVGLAAVKGTVLNRGNEFLVVDFKAGFDNNKSFIPKADYRMTIVEEQYCALERDVLKRTF